jgi:preprotein translocase subunit SecD
MKIRIFIALALLTSMNLIVSCNSSEQVIKRHKEEEIAARQKGGVSDNLKFYLTQNSPDKGLTEVTISSGEKIYVQKTPVVTSSDIAEVKTNEIAEGYEFRLDLNAEGTKKVYAATKDNIGKRIAFYYNDEFCSAPVIREAIDSGSFMAFKPKTHSATRQ